LASTLRDSARFCLQKRIGEAVEHKHLRHCRFAFGTGENLSLNLAIDDPHKKGVAADEFGMGSARPTAEGSDLTIFPSDYDCRGSSQASSLSAGFS